MKNKISIFSNVKDTTPKGEIELKDYVAKVSSNENVNLFEQLRSIKDKKERNKVKEKLECVTLSGTFSTRKNSSLIKHSELICIDIDNVDNVEEIKAKLISDPYTCVAHFSASGNGLSVIVKIVPNKHLDSFLALERYYWVNYHIEIDKACKDVSRLRYISYDPAIFSNYKSKIFKEYIKDKPVPKKKIGKVIHVKSNFDRIINECKYHNVTNDSYEVMLTIGFGLASEFGENGRDYFHALCSSSSKYSYQHADIQYNKCLKSTGHGVTIASVYYYIKEQCGDSILYCDDVKEKIVDISYKKRDGNTKEQILNQYNKKEDQEIVKQIFETDFDFKKNLEYGVKSDMDEVMNLIKKIYNPRYNIFNQKVILQNGKPITNRFINSMILRISNLMGKDIPSNMISNCLGSNEIEDYDPVKEVIDKNIKNCDGTIDKLISAFYNITDFEKMLIKKYLVGMMVNLYDENDSCPYILVLISDKHGSGKTEWFRRLLPLDFKKELYAERSKFDDKDTEILLTNKIIVMNDEFGGMSKTDVELLKDLASKRYFTVRKPYERISEDCRRLATLGGTSNREQILNDPTGNRRILPIDMRTTKHGERAYCFDTYNSVDKCKLLAEAYKLYKNGYEWQLTTEEINQLADETHVNNVVDEAEEVLSKIVIKRTDEELTPYDVESLVKVSMTATEIKEEMINTSRAIDTKISVKKISSLMKKLGLQTIVKRSNGKLGRYFSFYTYKKSQDYAIERQINAPF